MRLRTLVAALSMFLLLTVTSASAAVFTFTTGSPNGQIGVASQPSGANNGNVENETGDDFVLSSPTVLTGATFTGLLPVNFNLGNISSVTVEIYRVFPLDSVNPPSGKVPTRVNSPSDDALTERTTDDGSLTFTTTVLNATFSASNSVLNGIHPIPNQTTGGEGAISGEEVQFNVTFKVPLSLNADHYFFVPQVGVSGSGNFFWLSAARPNVINPFAPDLQAWTRNSALDPDWLRVGTDIIGGTAAFNESFSLAGNTIPEPSTVVLMLAGLAAVGWRRRRK